MVAKDPRSARVVRHIGGCDDGPCPNWYELDSAEFMFQGQQVTDATTLDGIQVAPGEIFVRVPRELVLEGMARLRRTEPQ